MIEFAEPFSEPCLSCSPLVGDLNNFYRHSNISYGDPFGSKGKQFNLANTCPNWTHEGLFEWHWSIEKESEIRFQKY